MIEARLDWAMQMDAYELRVIDRRQGGEVAEAVIHDGRLGFSPLENPLSIIEPVLVIPGQVAKPVIDAFRNVNVADGSSIEHLRDAITVRDRLLTMIEKGAA